MEKSSLVEKISVFSGNGVHCLGVLIPNKDVSMFLSMLRSPSVCDAVMPFWFPENLLISVVLIFGRFPEISGHYWLMILLNCLIKAIIVSIRLLSTFEGSDFIYVHIL